MAIETPVRVGFIGAGKMATALAAGLCRAGFTTPAAVIACDLLPAAAKQFAAATGAGIVASVAEVAQRADVVVVAVKPQQVGSVLAELAGVLEVRHLVVSIAAGVSLEALCGTLGARRRIVRVMPNTPCLVGESASAFSVGGGATPDDARLVERMFAAVGLAIALPESLLDAVTGLSGSGPAFVYLMIEALSDGGVRMGLPRPVALQLAAQTVRGAARMVLETGTHPGELKDAVASPAGTTIAGLHALEIGGVRGCLMNAVEAATLRSRELGRGS